MKNPIAIATGASQESVVRQPSGWLETSPRLFLSRGIAHP